MKGQWVWNYKPYYPQKLPLLKCFQGQLSAVLETSCLVYLTFENLANNFNVTFYLVFYICLLGDVWRKKSVLIMEESKALKSIHSQRVSCHIAKSVTREGERKVIHYSQLAPESYGYCWVICPPWSISGIFVDYLFLSGIIWYQNLVKRSATQNFMGGRVLLLTTYTI